MTTSAIDILEAAFLAAGITPSSPIALPFPARPELALGYIEGGAGVLGVLERLRAQAPEHALVLLGSEHDVARHAEVLEVGASVARLAIEQGRWVHATLARGVHPADLIEHEVELSAPTTPDHTTSLSMKMAEDAPATAPLPHQLPPTLAMHERVACALCAGHRRWHLPALLDFGHRGASPAPSVHVGLLRWWEDEWGAQLVSITPDALDVSVRRKPATLRAAMELAQIHHDYCPGVLHESCPNLMVLARALMQQDIWSFRWP